MSKSAKKPKHYKAARDRHTKGLTIWFTVTEYDEIARRAGKLSKSGWVRDQLLSLMAMP